MTNTNYAPPVKEADLPQTEKKFTPVLNAEGRELVRFIGDVHGLKAKYHQIIRFIKHRSLQVGDFGFRREHEWHIANCDPDQHKVNPGNHDDPDYFNSPHCLGNFSYWGNVFSVRGAASIDKQWRREGVDWWPEEQLNVHEGYEAYESYIDVKPRTVVSHDCPQDIKESIFGYFNRTPTNGLLQQMFQAHQPELWIFGHYHRSVDIEFNGTRFICLNELEYKDLWI